MELELRHLKTVRAIAEAGSLTKAATGLGLTQAALSAQLKRIERVFGGTLFERGSEGARPTPLGRLVVERAEVLLPAVRELQQEAARLANLPTAAPSRLRVGVLQMRLYEGLWERLTAECADALVTFVSFTQMADVARQVAVGRLDFALGGACGHLGTTYDDRLTWRDIAIDPVFVLLPHNHPLATEPELHLAQLADEHWVSAPGRGDCFTDCFAAACARAGFTPRSHDEADTPVGVRLVETGRAVALCAAAFAPPPGTIAVPLAGTPMTWRQIIGWHPDSPAAALADRAIACARQAHAEVVRHSPAYLTWTARTSEAATP
ncbi:LysR family transcriptional regulator [Kitasatospora sp. NPDC048194]|uniref:LysR family transcriptional regulator n=1 Tax=Kitasatospora sp. NPDC048194 TaxID=3364045 RepID=UPI0037143699